MVSCPAYCGGVVIAVNVVVEEEDEEKSSIIFFIMTSFHYAKLDAVALILLDELIWNLLFYVLPSRMCVLDLSLSTSLWSHADRLRRDHWTIIRDWTWRSRTTQAICAAHAVICQSLTCAFLLTYISRYWGCQYDWLSRLSAWQRLDDFDSIAMRKYRGSRSFQPYDSIHLLLICGLGLQLNSRYRTQCCREMFLKKIFGTSTIVAGRSQLATHTGTHLELANTRQSTLLYVYCMKRLRPYAVLRPIRFARERLVYKFGLLFTGSTH